MYTMTHYVHRSSDGTVHVQNAVSGLLGQHHVHTVGGFDAWVREVGVSPSSLRETNTPDCPCGLKPGQVRDHEGNITTNEKWERLAS